MLYVSVERIIHRRPEVVWELMTDVRSVPSWMEWVISIAGADVTPHGEAKLGRGVVLEVVARRAARRDMTRARLEITRWEPPTLVVVETRSDDVLLLDRITLSPHELGTNLRVVSEILHQTKLARLTRSPFPGRDLAPVEALYERSLDALKKHVEAASAAPYR